MPEIDVKNDTVLRDRALEEVETFVRSKGTPVSRAQIAGLLQIASNQPGLLSRFSGSQKNRAEKRAAGMNEGERKEELLAEVAFWALIQTLSEGKGTKCPWSLLQAREADYQQRPDLHQEKFPAGANLSREQREDRERKRQEIEAWVRGWDRDHYTGFFRHFCAHYLYHMPTENR